MPVFGHAGFVHSNVCVGVYAFWGINEGNAKFVVAKIKIFFFFFAKDFHSLWDSITRRQLHESSKFIKNKIKMRHFIYRKHNNTSGGGKN